MRNLPKDHPVLRFIEENNSFKHEMDSILSLVERSRTRPSIELLFKVLSHFYKLREVQDHYKLLEVTLFPVLQKQGVHGLLSSTLDAQNKVLSTLEVLSRQLTSSLPQNLALLEPQLMEFDVLLREAVQVEESLLFPAALEIIPEDDWKKIGGRKELF